MYYDTTLQQAFARGLKTRPNDLSSTCKLSSKLGRYLLSEYNGTFYSKAQNLGRELCKAYDKVFEDYGVLLMPTVPKKASTFPPANPSLEGRDRERETFIIIKTQNEPTGKLLQTSLGCNQCLKC